MKFPELLKEAVLQFFQTAGGDVIEVRLYNSAINGAEVSSRTRLITLMPEAVFLEIVQRQALITSNTKGYRNRNLFNTWVFNY